MEQATHCQICAREIKSKTGTIAHHGYQRPGGGWQTASCLGAKYKPYEESRDRIPEVQNIYKESLDFNKKRLTDTLNNPPATITRYAMYGFQKDETHERPKGFDVERELNRGSWGFGDGYSYEYNRLVQEIKRNIEGLTNEIEWLDERYNKWEGVRA